MKFKRYPSIENSYRQKFIDMITINPELMSQQWIVMEKLNGTHLDVYIDVDGTIKFAKRSGFIKEDEKFYSLDVYADEIKNYFKDVRSYLNVPNNVIVISGEFFGGGYSHPDVENLNVSQVQKGVQYTNRCDFLSYDVKVDEERLDWDKTMDMFEDLYIPYAPVLMTGTFEECIKFPNDNETIIPEEYSLPKIDNNISEGVVIKPNKTFYFNNGSRVILKNKNEKFTEKSKTKKRSVVTIFSPEMDVAVNNMGQYINENRLNNVLSHIGVIKQKDFGKVCGLFSQDVILDYLKDYESLPEKKDWKLVTKQTSMSCAMLLRSRWLDILDGDY